MRIQKTGQQGALIQKKVELLWPMGINDDDFIAPTLIHTE